MKFRQLVFLLLFLPSTAFANSLRIQIHGISGEALDNVKERLNVTQTTEGEDFFRLAPKDIREALQPFGYFKPIISAKQNQNTAIFTIDPGPLLKITRAEIKIVGEGHENPELKKFLATFPLAPGQPLNIKNYEAAKENLFRIANNQGYLKAALSKKEIRIDLKSYSAQIILIFDTGPRYYFGHVNFEKSPYAPQFLQRFDQFKPNEPYSSQKLIKFQEDLYNSHYFRSVQATPDFSQQSGTTIPVNVATTVPRSQRYDVGLGYGTYTGPRLSLGANFRRVTDTGQHFDMQLKLSSVLRGLTATYYIPGKNPLTEQYTLGANVQYFDPKNGTSFSQTLSGTYQKTMGDWQRSASLNFLSERFMVVTEPTHRSELLYPSATLSRIKADDMIFPRLGSMFSFTLQGASQDIFSKTSFIQAETKAKGIFSPTSMSRVIVRGDVGYTTVENLNQLPLTLRYFAGGLGTVRGYPYSTIGPGKYLEVGSVEIQHKLIGDWYGAAFYDVGNASNTFNSNFNRGQGLGIIYQSFVGPVQLYVGQALSKPGKPYALEFSIGPDF